MLKKCTLWLRMLVFSALAAATVTEIGAAADAELNPLLSFRWRQESLDTLSNDGARDNTYSFGNLRLRFGLDVDWERVSVHALAHAAGAYSLPERASFGIGGTYFGASGGDDTSPGHVRLVELSLRVNPSDEVSITGGRIGIQDGAETFSGDARLDWIKRARISERLIGTWDWVNVGRRFDGGTVAIDTEDWHLFGFGARMLQGGVDYDDAFEHLNGVDTAGVVFTSKQGWWLASSEIRLFDIVFRDARPSTESLLGVRLLVNAVGGSLIGVYPTDAGAWDLMLWLAYQFGEFGIESHRAAAVIAEGGFGWPESPGSPWLRGGVAIASGDGDPADDDHGTFFNMAPTNHKWYGLQDLNAFQNLTNFYGQLHVRPHPRLGLTLDAHFFQLTDTADAWYGGSGAPNNQSFGYVARRPAGESELSGTIGTELDLVASWTAHPRANVQVGVARFQGGSLAQRLFPVQDDFTWFYVQAVLRY